jgi:hypothetical protein
MVWHTDVLCRQPTIDYAALHLRQLLGELRKHSPCQRKRHFQTTPDIFHGMALGVSFREPLIHTGSMTIR